jgi:hypothetical protein
LRVALPHPMRERQSMNLQKPSSVSRALRAVTRCAGCERRRQFLAQQATKLRRRLSWFSRPFGL